MRAARPFVCLLVLFGWQVPGFAQTGGQTVADAQAALQAQAFDAFTAPFIQDCLDTAQQLIQWRSDYDELVKTGMPPDDWVQDVDAFMQKRSPEFLAFIQLKQKIDPIKAQADDDAAYLQQLAGLYHDTIFPLIDGLNQPAQTAKNALVSLAAKKVFDQPYTFPGGITLQVKGFDTANFTSSPFSSKKGGLSLVLLYLQGQPGEIRAEASGLYFKPDGTPVLDKVQLKTNATDVIKQALGQGLAKAIAQVDLPFASLNNVTWAGFAQGQGAAGGSFKFDVALKLGDGLDFLPNLQVKNVILRTDGTLDLGKDGVIVCGPFDEPIPVGPTPFVLTNHKISYAPRLHQGSLETDMVPSADAAGGDAPVKFHLEIDLSLPLKEVVIKGTAFVGDDAVGQVTGKITGKAIDVALTIPAPGGQGVPVDGLMKGTVKLHLDRDGLSGDGQLLFFQGLQATAQFVLKFNGNGSFGVSEGGQIGPLSANASLNGGFSPGFKRVTVNGALTLELDLDLMSVVASVDIDAASDRDPAVIATVRALGASAQLKLPNLARLDLDAIKGALKGVEDQLITNTKKVFADAEAEARQLGVEFDKGLRDSISDLAAKAGIASIDTGNPTLNNWLGQAAQGGKDLGGAVSNGVQTIESGLGSVYSQGSNALSSATGGLLLTDRSAAFPLSSSTLRSGQFRSLSSFDGAANSIDRAVSQEMRAAQLNVRLAAVVRAMNQLQVFQSSLPKGGTSKIGANGGKVSELRLRVRYCVSAPAGEDAALGFAIQVVGFTHQIDPRQKASRPTVQSGVYRGIVRIKGLYGKGKPTAEIDLPKMHHGSEFPADDLLRQAITQLLERLLPQVQEDGRFDERKLAVENGTGERVTVWVQTQTHPVKGDRTTWVWEPGQPGQADQAFKYVLGPKQTFLLIRTDRREALRGVAARIWAQSESGRIWNGNQKQNAWLVDDFEENDGRHYYAPTMETFVYRLGSSGKPVTFATRAVRVTNRTDHAVVVNARAQYFDAAAGWVWADGRPTRVEPGTTVTLERSDGALLHGAKALLWAQDAAGGRVRWVKYRTTPVQQVAAAGYQATQIGNFDYVLEAPRTAPRNPTAANGGTAPTAATLHLPADEVWVNDIQGKTVQEARADITSIGLRVSTDKGVPASARVTRQSPVWGWLAPGAEVHLSTTPARPPASTDPVAVPRVVGASLAQAAKRLQAAGLSARVTNDPEQGAVQKQSPAEGTKVVPGTAVHLTFVSAGDKAAAAAAKAAAQRKQEAAANAALAAAAKRLQATAEKAAAKRAEEAAAAKRKRIDEAAIEQTAKHAAKFQRQQQLAELEKAAQPVRPPTDAAERARWEAARRAAHARARAEQQQAREKALLQAARRAQEQASKRAEDAAKLKAEHLAEQRAMEKAQLLAEEKARKTAEQKVQEMARQLARQKVEAQKAAREEFRKAWRADAANQGAADKAAEQKAWEAFRKKVRTAPTGESVAELQARHLAEQQALQQAHKLAERVAEQKARALAERKARDIAERKAQEIAEQKARQLAEERATLKAHQIAEMRAQEIARKKAQEVAARRARELAELQARQLAEKKADDIAAQKARHLAEQKAMEKVHQLAEQRARDLAEQKARQLAEAKARSVAEQKAQHLAEQRALEQAQRLAAQRAEELAAKRAQAKAQELAAERARQKAEQLAQHQAQERARRFAEEQARARARLLAERQAQEQARQERERQLAELRARQEAEQRRQAELAYQAEQRRQAELRQQAELQRQAELRQQAELQRQAELRQQAELQRQAEQQRRAEQEARQNAQRQAQQNAARRIVPNIRGLTYQQAVASIHAAGLQVHFTGNARARAMNQFPHPGTSVPAGSTVTVQFP